jgi:hypothetical protein
MVAHGMGRDVSQHRVPTCHCKCADEKGTSTSIIIIINFAVLSFIHILFCPNDWFHEQRHDDQLLLENEQEQEAEDFN